MNYTLGRKKKIKTAVKIAVIILVIILAGLYILGATLGSDSEARNAVSSAIKENNRLKSEISAKDERINELDNRVKELEAQLGAIPTQAPTPYMPEITAEPTQENGERSPRGN